MKDKEENNNMHKKIDYYIITTILCAVICVFALSLQLTMSFFFDTDSKNGVFSFGAIRITSVITDTSSNASNLNFSASEVYPGATIDKNIQLTVPNESESCYIRIWMSFKESANAITNFETTPESSYMSMTIRENTSEWPIGRTSMPNGKACYYYYNSTTQNAIVNKNTTVTVAVRFTYSETAPNVNQDNHFAIRVYVEAVQSVNNAYQTVWNNQYPSTNWPTL